MILTELIKKISFSSASGSMPLIPGFGDFEISFNGFYGRLITIAIGIAVVTAITLVSSAGYQMMMSSGDPSKLKASKEQINNAIMGLLLIILAVGLTMTIFEMLGITSFLG